MGEESPQRMSPPSGAVFLSYASQDAEVAQKICDALRAAGIEVWLDQSELRGGDAWDRKIRDQIRHCALFIPVISEHSQARLEGYFRREWKFAVERKRDIADELAFLLPVVIDETPERGASVPEGFHEVQWTRLPEGTASQEFIAHVSRLLTSHQDDPSRKPATTVLPTGPVPNSSPPMRVRIPASSRSRWMLTVSVGVLVAGAAVYFAGERFRVSKPVQPAVPPPASASAPPVAFSPPPHSIAVLPFVNMSGDKEQEYFSEGLTEELLNSLSRINELQVAARTSSFSLASEHPDIATVAHKLNVGAVLEGSVRRSAHTVRITAQLINGVTGFHLWSETYDRDLGDVLRLQSEIATAVAGALKVTLLGDEAAKIEIGGTRNPAALDAYLRAMNAWWKAQTEKETLTAIDGYTEAIHLDPEFALAYAERSTARTDFSTNWAKGPVARDYLNEAAADAREAVSLAPNLAEGHLSLGLFYETTLEFTTASQEYQRALTLAPGKAEVLVGYGLFAVSMGQSDAGLGAQRRGMMLDPLNTWYRVFFGQSLRTSRRYDEAIVTLTDAKALAPNDVGVSNQADAWIGLTQYAKGDYSGAKTTCDHLGAFEEELKYLCLAVSLNKLGRRADAEIMLGKFRTSAHNDGRRRVGESIIYAQWGDTARALDALDAAMRVPDVWLESVKADCIFDPLRNEPRFQAIERALKFPN